MRNKSFRDGHRVRHIGFQFHTGVPNGMTGTVAERKAWPWRVNGKLANPKFVPVNWDNGNQIAVFSRELDRE